MTLLDTDVTNNIQVYDPLTVDWSKFQWKNGFYIHKITIKEIEKPYLISYAYYKNIEYEDIILLVNNIQNVWEVVPGKELKIPKIDDIKNFILLNKQKQNV